MRPAILAIFILGAVLALAACSDESDDHFSAGSRLQDQGRLEEAVAEYTEAIRLNPRFATAYFRRGSASRHAELGDTAGAIEDFDTNIELNPSFVKAYVSRGVAYVALGQIDAPPAVPRRPSLSTVTATVPHRARW